MTDPVDRGRNRSETFAEFALRPLPATSRWPCQLSKLYAIATAALCWAARDDDDGRSRIASAFAISRCRWVGCPTIYAVSVIENHGLIRGWRF